jgi:carboxypeptidase Taq
MHVILRFEIEQDLLNGNLAVSDVPAAWNQKMKEFLGIIPRTNRDGCLQDIHWAMVGLGYFPTYTLGNFYAAQFFETALHNNAAIAGELENGEITTLLTWLQENIQQHGRKLTPAEVVRRTTQQPLSHEPFVRYATGKFSEIYKL